jgi:NAD(P)-dependent dehydrogenase (short-subunit alcohol dehydrogenase family)
MQSTKVADQGLLAGKVAVITGAGSGVGRAMANLFARNGCALGIVDVIDERIQEVASELSLLGTKVVRMKSDLSVKEEPEKMIDEMLSSLGKIDVLCNNAGIMDGARPVADTPDDVWEKVMNINLNAPFRASRRALPTMVNQGSGVILNTASIAGLFGGVAGAAYTTSKHALIGLTRSIAAHYGAKGIRCNAMVLGGVNTNIGFGAAQPNPEGAQLLYKVASLMPRTGDPKEVAELALFLVSDKSKFMNGSCVVIDAGWSVF